MPMTWWGALIWWLALALGSFLVTWIFADKLRMRRTPYIGVLAVVTGGFLYGYLSWSTTDWVTFLTYQWIWGLIGALVTGPLIVLAVSRGAQRSKAVTLEATPRPEGLRLAGALLWEGVVYGAAEALLLSVLPALMVWQALTALGWTQSWIGATLTGLVALAASVVVIVVHHLGYPEFRGPLLAVAALTCGALTGAYLLTVNPLSAVGGHIIMHAGAVLKGVELPPHQEGEGDTVGTKATAQLDVVHSTR